VSVLGQSQSTTDEDILVGGTYGVLDKLEVGGEYSNHFQGSDNAGILTAHAAYAVAKGEQWDLAAAAAFNIDLDSGGGIDLEVGAWFRYHLTPMISLFTGNPALPHSAIANSGFILPPGLYQAAFGLNNGNPVDITFPVGVGIQATPTVYAYASLTIADLELSPNSNQDLIFKDFTPVAVGLFYSMDKLDIGAQLAVDDIANLITFYDVSVIARYYVK
jgi:hypothetical protein